MKTIFDYDQMNGLSVYQDDVIKLLLEDDEFFNETINTINQNDFHNWMGKSVVGLMKDLWREENLRCTYDTLRTRGERFFYDKYSREELEEYISQLTSTVLTEERIAEVKGNLKYWRLFYNVVKATNHLRDAVYGEKVYYLPRLVEVAKRLLDDAKIVEDELKMVGEPFVSMSAANDWPQG